MFAAYEKLYTTISDFYSHDRVNKKIIVNK